METSLHRELKRIYAGADGDMEVSLDCYRIDAVRPGELVEIQHGSLGAIRDKIRTLLERCSQPAPDNDPGEPTAVRVVKPIIAEKMLVKQARRGGKVVGRRRSPKRGSALDIFEDLVHFTSVFPHSHLVLEMAMVEIDELRYPGHGRRRRRRQKDFQVEDQRLLCVRESMELRTAEDLWRLLPETLPARFDTAQLAETMNVTRSAAQRVAYCLRETGAIKQVGKNGNALLYKRAA